MLKLGGKYWLWTGPHVRSVCLSLRHILRAQPYGVQIMRFLGEVYVEVDAAMSGMSTV